MKIITKERAVQLQKAWKVSNEEFATILKNKNVEIEKPKKKAKKKD